MRVSLRLLSVSALGLSAACAASVPPRAPPPVVATPPLPPQPPDLRPVPSPGNLVFSGRISSPAASLKVATDWAHLPSLDPTTIIEAIITAQTERKADAKLATVVDPAQPIDFAAAFEVKLPPRALGAFSAAVTNIDAARAALASTYELRAGDNGVIRLVLRADVAGEAGRVDPEDAPACELAPAAGASPFRLVCGSSQAALNSLGPYLTRTTPRQVVPADVHFEVRAGSIAGFATLARMEGPRAIAGLLGLNSATEPARAELLSAALEDVFDLVSDLDAVMLDATLDPAHAGLVYRATFRSTTSLLARLATGHAERATAPPDSLWLIPAEVDAASFGSGVDEADLQHPRELVVAALDEELDHEKLAAADRRALTGLVKESLRGTRGLLAHGTAHGAPYWVFERDEPAPGLERIVRDAAAARGRPGVAKWATAEAHTQKGGALPTVTLAAPLAWLPRGSLHAILTIPHTPGTPVAPPLPAVAPTKPLRPAPGVDVYQFAMMPDGPRTWVAISPSEAAVKAALASVTAPALPADALGSRASARGLDDFKTARMTAGGFLTVRAFVELARSAAEGQADPRWDAVLEHLPSKGVTPILVTSTPLGPTSDDPGGIREVRVAVPADAIRDAVWFGLQADSLKKP